MIIWQIMRYWCHNQYIICNTYCIILSSAVVFTKKDIKYNYRWSDELSSTQQLKEPSHLKRYTLPWTHGVKQSKT